jgi:4-hydroxy-3-polyprenylbenzoate decarboxylase
MLAFAEMGGIVFPPVPAFYALPKTIDDLVGHTVARVLERMGLGRGELPEWTGGGRRPSEG